MSSMPNHRHPVLTILFCLIIAGLTAVSALADEVHRLDNGMEVIFKESHGSPMIASIIFIRSGSRYETPYENGITHLLEHLLFDGTIHMNRLQLDESISHLGGYINAFTRKDLTAYLVLLPKQYITYGLTVQADMLTNSIFPDEELAKERQVVIEEIRQGMDSPTFAAERFAVEKTMAGTNYARPVIGYEEFIARIPKEAIADYYKRNYRPGNMTALVIGDFETAEMKASFEQIFGAIPDSLPPTTGQPTEIFDRPPDPARVYQYDTVAAVPQTHIDISFAAPAIQDSAYIAMDLLARYLNLDDISQLKQALLAGDPPLASEASVGLTPYSGFSRLEVSVLTDQGNRRHEIVDSVVSIISAVANQTPADEILNGIRVSARTEGIYYAEKLHYYGFIIAPYVMTGGWQFVQEFGDRLNAASWEQSRAVAGAWLSQPSYVATMVRPPADSSAQLYQPETLSAAEVSVYYDTATFAQHDLFAGHNLVYPDVDSVVLKIEDGAQYHREVLENGLTLLVKSDSSSQVFAMCVLGKDRTLREPDGQEGITDFVNHMLEKGTISRDAATLANELAGIGANVTLYDNPWIPYDDRYTTRRFSFMKFETIEPFARRGLVLFGDMIKNPSFDPEDIETVRRQLLGSLGRAAGSPRQVARELFHNTLFDGHPYARSVSGTSTTIAKLTRNDLTSHHRRFYSPQNMIIAVASSQAPDVVVGWIKEEFGNLPQVASLPAVDYSGGPPSNEQKVAHEDLASEQVNIYIGGPAPGANHEQAVAARVAATILSDRLYHNLREEQGLAYSVGTGLTQDKNYGWYRSVISTGSDNYEAAVRGIKFQTEKLRLDGPTTKELSSAKNHIWGRLASAKLSRVNQAYYLAVDEYLGRKPGYDQEYLEKLARVNIDAVRRVMARYFRTNTGVAASAGTRP